MVKVYIPRETTADSLGAELLVKAIATEAKYRKLDIEIVRNGSRGACWLEPLVEVETDKGRVGYGPVTLDDVPDLFDADFLNDIQSGGKHAKFLGDVDKLPWFANQERLTFARCGIIEATSVAAYASLGGFVGLKNAMATTPDGIIEEMKASGLRGRGGAAFPTAIKWRTVADQPPAPHSGESQAAPAHKYICVNADEGDSGTFADRMLMEGDPFCLLEGMTIAAHAVGADRGLVYLRSEYPDAIATLQSAIWIAREQGWLGANILGSDLCFDVEIRVGAGSYVCGEETAMLESLEGRRGMVRAKPPLPAIKGLFGTPTVINNVLTIASVPSILARGAKAYAALGQNRSLGTQVFQLAGNIARGGIVETAFGISARELIEDFGGGTRSGRPLRAVQIGGPLGAYLSPEKLDVAMEYEALIEAGGMIGHGGVVLFDDTVNMAEQARFAMDFCVEESCGKCTPCRIGAVRGVETIDKIRAGQNVEANTELLRDLCDVMTHGSLCAMGGLTPNPVLSALNSFPEDFASTVIATG